MQIFGKLFGAAAGFAIGGPLGALLGGMAGHVADEIQRDPEDGRGAANDQDRIGQQDTRSGDRSGPFDARQSAKPVAFTIAVIVLGAKLAKADGHVTKDEVAAFKEIFHIPASEARNVGRLFNQARKDSRGFEPYARQIQRMFRDNPRVLEELIDALFHIARADGTVGDEELTFLRRVAELFGFGDRDFERMRAANLGPSADDPYQVLGLTHDASDDELKSAYRQLVRENHPDTLVAQGLPDEFVEMANEKLATINNAYDRIRKQRDSS